MTSIFSVDNDIIIIKNAFSEKLKQNCDDRELTLTGNYFVILNNCSLTFHNETFLNI